jgi:Zn finger protein HypA/HybF involved in hydrogenase expression
MMVMVPDAAPPHGQAGLGAVELQAFDLTHVNSAILEVDFITQGERHIYMRLAAIILTFVALVLLSAGPSADVEAQDGESDIALIEQWLSGGAVPFWHPKAWSRSVVAEATPAASGLLIDRHTAAGVPCESCHAASKAEPGDQHPPVPILSFDATCVTCHGTMLEAPEGKEMSFPNPHVSPHLAVGEVPRCTECHRVHDPGEVTCNLCHRGFNFSID